MKKKGCNINSSLQQRNRILFLEKDRETGLFLSNPKVV